VRRWIALAAGLLSLGGAAPATAADHAISSHSVTSVDAFGGMQVWDVPSGGRWRLYSSSKSVAAVPVKRSARPFDADLGARLGGGVATVYRRCRTSHACAIYRFDFKSKRERRERRIHRRGCSEGKPATWRGQLAFVRSGGRGCKPGIYVRGSGKGARPRRLSKVHATALDLRARIVLWQDATRIGLVSFSGKQTILATGKVTLVGFDSTKDYWLEARGTRSVLVRLTNNRQSREEAELSAQRRYPGSAAVDGRRYFYRLAGSSGRLFEADPFPFPGV
jgi:hypothetical protein